MLKKLRDKLHRWREARDRQRKIARAKAAGIKEARGKRVDLKHELHGANDPGDAARIHAELADLHKKIEHRIATHADAAKRRDLLAARIRRVVHRIAHIKDSRKGGGAAAVKWAVAQIGTTEQPYGSNTGPGISDWERYIIGVTGVYWCGCFAGYAAVHEGNAQIPSPSRLASGYYIIADAHAGVNGLHAVPFSEAKPGDILVYWGGEHIGLARTGSNGTSIATVEGNTSSSTGSQSNGGGVFAKIRSASDVTVVARPNYP